MTSDPISPDYRDFRPYCIRIQLFLGIISIRDDANVIRFIRQSKEHDLYRISVADTPVYCLQTLDVKLLHPFMLKRYC